MDVAHGPLDRILSLTVWWMVAGGRSTDEKDVENVYENVLEIVYVNTQ